MERAEETSAPTLNRESTYTCRVVTGKESPDGLRGGHAQQSASSSTSDMSDDLHGLLIPGKNVILRFESMSAAELKVRGFPIQDSNMLHEGFPLALLNLAWSNQPTRICAVALAACC